MVSFRLKEEKRCLHAHWSLQPTHFLKDWMPIFIVDPVISVVFYYYLWGLTVSELKRDLKMQ